MGVEQRVVTEPSIIRQAGELMPEAMEVPPYAPTFVPPFPFTNGSSSGSTATTEGFTQVPDTYDLTVVRGDTVDIKFFFEHVCWTPTAPTGTPQVPWEQHFWNAQVRNPKVWPFYGGDPCYWYNNWIPVFGIYPNWLDWFKATLIAEFAVTAEYVDDFESTGVYGTLITMHLDSVEMVHWPSNDYRWDLQSATEKVMTDDVPPVFDHFEGVRTWLQGTFTIIADYTVNPTKGV